MKPLVRIGDGGEFTLSQAILVYQSDNRGEGFATVHGIATHDIGAPTLMAGEVVSVAFLAKLAESLGSRLTPEYLPANVLSRTPHLICWWTPAQQRRLFYRKGSSMQKLNAKTFPIPALMWRLSGHELHVRALAANKRPSIDTKLYVAPFWNTNDVGLVCQGSMRHPESGGVDGLAGWADGYFQSEFTHAFGVRNHTKHKKGFEGLWKALAGKKLFPAEYLQDAKQAVQQFIEGKCAQD